MNKQKITLTSPASLAVLQMIEQQPGITAAIMAERGGWSIYHIRNVLRFLKAHGRVISKRPISNQESYWHLGDGVPLVKPQRKTCVMPITRAANSIFALSAL